MTESPAVPRPQCTEAEIREYVARCPDAQKLAFEGWLRGTHHLDGERIQTRGGARR